MYVKMILGINWNPSPEIFRVFNFPIRYYGLMFVVAFILGIYLLKKIYKNEHVKEEYIDSLFLYVVVATIIGARLGEVFFYSWDYYQNNLLEIILPVKFNPFRFIGFRGLASHGATIGIALAMYFYTKKYNYKPLLWILDKIVIPIASGAIFVRIGNLMNSEIVGKKTDNSLGFRFIRNYYDGHENEIMQKTGAKTVDRAYELIENSPRFKDLLDAVPFRHPTQIYESLSYLVVFLILWFVYWKTDKKYKTGYLFGLFMVLLWSVRFVIEFFKEAQIDSREDWIGTLNTGQILSIPMVMIGLYFMFRRLKDSQNMV
jgi:prolipoprotein diacylglyceryl transferase